MTVTANELLAVMGSRELRDDQTVFTGVGAPMLAAGLAQRLHAPGLTMVIEGGIVGPEWKPGWLPISTNEMRAAHRARMLPAITDLFLLAQRGFLDVGFIGGAQIDAHGNVNTTVIGSFARPRLRLPGSGGANDITSLCREVIILTTHEPRRFVEKVDFVTSPGHLAGGDSRERAGLLFGRVSRVVTTLGMRPVGNDRFVIGSRLSVFAEQKHRPEGFLPSPGYEVVDVFVSMNFDGRVIGVINIDNIFNRYYTQYQNTMPSRGRTLKVSLA